MKRIALLALALTVQTAAYAAGDVQAGGAVFARKCASCHSVGPSARGAFGPQLNAIFGRVAGATSDYQYSPEMKKSGIVWSQKTLSAFIQSPSKVVPGTRMRFWGISDERQIEDLLAYLHAYK
ncbi:c-type cytochrome [Cupriavidus basilensis]|uniref:C-type cytochrome n=1 Tax=Cupriavidus basilensis TaxID=68895 RepID=A0ABT6B3I6_9BURK|nr:c-type cytochrome [Cupriavidus basilensis]MDF3839429.1 c-type cytochrome [Cupriavidus basilensis]